MSSTKQAMQMPELLVFIKMVIIGFFVATIWWISFFLGSSFAIWISAVNPYIKLAGISFITLICCSYVHYRRVYKAVVKLGCSLRIDLLVALISGVWINTLIWDSAWLSKARSIFLESDPEWGLIVLTLLSIILLHSLISQMRSGPTKSVKQGYFIGDDEISDDAEDMFGIGSQAHSFANSVLDGGNYAGLVFGVDGPWGVGKTSFINLAEQHWKKAEDKVIVCRFEPLRYASEPDLAERLIRELSAVIEQKVFTPEFRSAATRYSRLIKGKADISFLGFKLSLEPSQDSVDDLLDDIDNVLKRIGYRVIIVIDDLDRLDAKTTNNVLFATRRTFKLSQATYVLCYDTEVLARGQEESTRAREFIEKFVALKLSLLVDSAQIRDYLTNGWKQADNQLSSIPSDTMNTLGEVLSELANILDGDLAADYLPLVGDLRKAKRLINSMLLMQIEKTKLGRTDFNKHDLINLILLHLHYPGIFRRIYAEETENRCGTFSVRRSFDSRKLTNSDSFHEQLSCFPATASFLLGQLFDVETLGLSTKENIDEFTLRSRACFNYGNLRNLEAYLKLIVRFKTPDHQSTYIFYQKAFDKVRKGEQITSILTSPEFQLEKGETLHDEFWRVLAHKSNELKPNSAEDAISTLVDFLPKYSFVKENDRGLRQRSIHTLLNLLDRAGWGDATKRRQTDEVVEIAWRIFGEQSYQNRGLLDRLISKERGVIGWFDLMVFRSYCSVDRQGQLHNLYTALIRHQDKNLETTGAVSKLAIIGMRRLSQEIFALFKQNYIEPRKNFLAEVNDTPDIAFVGQEYKVNHDESIDCNINNLASMARSIVKSYVVFQLSNKQLPNSSGIGCGYYDEQGTHDKSGIAEQMNDYMFDVCFNPSVDENNIFYFFDYCLSNLNISLFSDTDEEKHTVTRDGIVGAFNSDKVASYWRKYKDLNPLEKYKDTHREIHTSNYVASYQQYLDDVYFVLDEIAYESFIDIAAIEALGR